MDIQKFIDDKNLIQGLASRDTLHAENDLELSDIDPLLIERRFRKVNPDLISRSIRLAQKFGSTKHTFLLDIYFVQGTNISSQIRKILGIVGTFIGCHGDKYLQIEISCTLQDILLISEDKFVVWIDGEPFP